MTDFSAIHSDFERNNLPYFTFSTKSQKRIKAVMQQLPFTAPAGDISDGFVNLGINVISI
jgi:hypothetical protein